VKEEAVIDVAAALCAWRVFGISQSFYDMVGENWSAELSAGPTPADILCVTVGDIPDHVVRGVREFHANTTFILGTMFGDHYAGKSDDECEQILQTMTDEADDVEARIRGKFPTWLTLELCRPRAGSARVDLRYRWMRGDVVAAEELSEFAEESGEFLDLAFAQLLRVLPDRLRLDRATLVRRRTYVTAPGKATFGVPDLRMSATGQVTGGGWTELPFSDIETALAGVEADTATVAPLIRTPTHWLLSALSEESDPLRRFQFAFFGLEVLTNKVGKQIESSVVEDLTIRLGGLPVGRLVWPTSANADRPWRNLTFRFALVAVGVAPTVAAADIETFHEFLTIRNDLAHGTATSDAIEALPAWQAIAFLSRYIGAVVAAGATGAIT
jgi:hypothetical protein